MEFNEGDRVQCMLCSALQQRELRFVGMCGTVLKVDDAVLVQFDGESHAVWIMRPQESLRVIR